MGRGTADFNAVWLKIGEPLPLIHLWLPPLISLLIGGATIFVLCLTLREMKKVRILAHEPNIVLTEGEFDLVFVRSQYKPFKKVIMTVPVFAPQLINVGAGSAINVKVELKVNQSELLREVDFINENQAGWFFESSRLESTASLFASHADNDLDQPIAIRDIIPYERVHLPPHFKKSTTHHLDISEHFLTAAFASHIYCYDSFCYPVTNTFQDCTVEVDFQTVEYASKKIIFRPILQPKEYSPIKDHDGKLRFTLSFEKDSR